MSARFQLVTWNQTFEMLQPITIASAAIRAARTKVRQESSGVSGVAIGRAIGIGSGALNRLRQAGEQERHVVEEEPRQDKVGDGAQGGPRVPVPAEGD